jgi:hypothetical protein
MIKQINKQTNEAKQKTNINVYFSFITAQNLEYTRSIAVWIRLPCPGGMMNISTAFSSTTELQSPQKDWL